MGGGVGEGDSAGEGDGDVSLGKCLELAFYLIAIKVNTKCFVMEWWFLCNILKNAVAIHCL